MPASFPVTRIHPLALAISMALVSLQSVAQTQPKEMSEVQVLGTAEEELKQAPGVSVITQEDLEKRPPANDLSELIRTMPGVNLTGNSSSGQYGNNRQIDLRGMGPENTLILIDGIPVSSRNSTRMGRSGERNTRGDSNWVPAEAIERIEVLRGPAAARYGSGAAGGVVNIITKPPTDTYAGSVTVYSLFPEHSAEGGSKRLGFNLSGPLADKLSFRLFGNIAKTEADSLALNQQFATGITPPAGREGVRNRDINALVRWALTEKQSIDFNVGMSRQGNIYAGDRAVSTDGTPEATQLAQAGAETNTLYRRTASVTHRGDWGAGHRSRLSFSYEGTDNTRFNEGLAGGPEGSIQAALQKSTSELNNYLVNGEYSMPSQLFGTSQVVTFGFDHRTEKLNDPYGNSQNDNTGQLVNAANRNGKAEASLTGLFAEDNIALTDRLTLTPGLRFDHHDNFGSNWSPSLNTSYQLTNEITLKGGIARAFKAPNLYQSNPNYLYYTMGQGCPVNYTNQGLGCYILGNADLNPETSINKEIGIAYTSRGWVSGLTYFHNYYNNKIAADMFDQGPPIVIGVPGSAAQAFQWFNAGKAIVQGLEGTLTVPLIGEQGNVLKLINNGTYMIENEQKSTGQPLSMIPRYTVNSTLDWTVNDKVSAQVYATFYGKQKARTLGQAGGAATGLALSDRGSYSLVGLSAGYKFSKSLSLRAGINNLFDKRLFRQNNSSGAGANTYNEPGRSLYVTMTASF